MLNPLSLFKSRPQRDETSALNGGLKIEHVTVGDSTRAFRYRGTEADTTVVHEIFHAHAFSLDDTGRWGKAVERLHARMIEDGRTPLIIDAGANIGASAIYFYGKYPRSRIVCFEPASDNFALLEDNTQGLDIDVRRAAIGLRTGTVQLVDPGSGAWGYSTSSGFGNRGAPIGSVDMHGMSSVIAESVEAGLTPFLVKIDIEGGEADLFDAPNDWIDQTPVIVMEPHDWKLPGQHVTQSFLKACATRDRDFLIVGETAVSLSNPMLREFLSNV